MTNDSLISLLIGLAIIGWLIAEGKSKKVNVMDEMFLPRAIRKRLFVPKAYKTNTKPQSWLNMQVSNSSLSSKN